MGILPAKRGDQSWGFAYRQLAVNWAHFDVGYSYKRCLSIEFWRLVIRFGWLD